MMLCQRVVAQKYYKFYIFYNNKYYAIGTITGLIERLGLNFSVSYNQHHINLINYIVNNGGQL